MQTAIQELRPDALEHWLAERGERPYRARQILEWVHRRGARAWDEMTNVPGTLRGALAESFRIEAPKVLRSPRSADGTRKFLLELRDGKAVESVLIPDDRSSRGSADRRTVCISSQVGCAMGCTFCATATLGWHRDLSAAEIVSQVSLVRRSLPEGESLTNLVFMGMGEPLHNADAVIDAIEILTAPWGQGMSPRRITVSTVGLVPKIERLLRETRVRLAISLTGTTDETRSRLMPVNRKYPLDVLLDACRRLPLARGRRITFEYVMLDGENDTLVDARRLVSLLHGIPVKVNLIPFNPFPGSPFRPTPPERVDAFRQALTASGIAASVRASRGRDIDAACGQLAARDECDASASS